MKDSAGKQSNRMAEENTWKAAAFSCIAAWQLGLRSGPLPYWRVHPNRIFHLGPKRQSSIRLAPNSFAW